MRAYRAARRLREPLKTNAFGGTYKGKGFEWAPQEDEILRDAWKDKTHAELGQILGRSARAVRNRCSRLQLVAPNRWSEDEIAALRAAYAAARTSSALDLPGLADRLRRPKTNVCRKARELGLTDPGRPGVEPEKKKVRKPRFASEAARAEYTSVIRKRWHAENAHPRGMLGKSHSEATKQRMTEFQLARAQALGPEGRAAIGQKSFMAKIAKGAGYVPRLNATWKAAWREIGGVRKFYRSRWEANYARYLEWLRARGEILEWKHEPFTFWFEGVKRGTVSYLPDFWVKESNGKEAYHEVKGWMDDRSRTKLARMAKHFPDVKLVLIDGNGYRAIARAVSAMIPDWERGK